MPAASPDQRQPALLTLLERMRAGDLRALSRLLSLVEDGAPEAAELLLARRSVSAALRIGVTGPPGAGKSTLADRLVAAYRSRGKTVAVLAVDPSSPYSGGALLGDRIRMQGFAGDEGVYIRSMASRGASGGLARSTADACEILQAAGRDVILIETVGAGQTEVEIAGLADVTLVVLTPGMGDEVQSMKAGMMEIADIFVINKADLPGADHTEAGIMAMQSLGEPPARGGATAWLPPIVRTVATTGEGTDDLVAQIERCASERPLPRRGLPGVGIAGWKVDHIGVAVRSIAVARVFYELLGLAVTHEEGVEHEQVRTAMLPLGDTRIELLEPIAEDSVIGRFLAKRGEGMHHVAIRLEGAEPGIEELFARLRAQGIRLASDCVRSGVGGHRYFFIHPASTGGVLLEIVADPSIEPMSGSAGEAAE